MMLTRLCTLDAEHSQIAKFVSYGFYHSIMLAKFVCTT